jgi:acyl carrier protein
MVTMSQEDEMAHRVIALVANALDVSVDDLDVETGIGDIPEWDSLAHLTILASLESELGFNLTLDQTLECETVSDIITVLRNSKNNVSP